MIPTGCMGAFEITRLGPEDDAEIAAFAETLEEVHRAAFLPEAMERHRSAIAREHRVLSLVRGMELVAIVIEQGSKTALPVSHPTVIVRQERRREGIGTALAARIEAADRESGRVAIAAGVMADDQPTAAFLTHLGFRHADTLLKMETPLTPADEIAGSMVDIRHWDPANTGWSEQIATLYNVHFARGGSIPPISADDIATSAAKIGTRLLVALERETEDLVGYIEWLPDAMVHSIVVRRRWGGRGVAEALVRSLKRHIKAEGGTKLTSFVSPRNAASLRLHRAEGAQEVDQMRTYKKLLGDTLDAT
ncbi:L-amino acid N-acyltransferase YncA [Rubricella aquisinus]|uniref:L-amino acid N-acyltransferase YncA n=1 Tax=Rubricella aquisinus TaxID=2028108 RepID=A0A840WP09_9RHOB|nr:GNAT family N-acetyltransferase [Rubricella aquisinus]MBB5515382.1 L-amino acid N-acyltransferase YncA [Rubricella aquisinus]